MDNICFTFYNASHWLDGEIDTLDHIYDTNHEPLKRNYLKIGKKLFEDLRKTKLMSQTITVMFCNYARLRVYVWKTGNALSDVLWDFR